MGELNEAETARPNKAQGSRVGGARPQKVGICLVDLLAALSTGKTLLGHLLLGCRAAAFQMISKGRSSGRREELCQGASQGRSTWYESVDIGIQQLGLASSSVVSTLTTSDKH